MNLRSNLLLSFLLSFVLVILTGCGGGGGGGSTETDPAPSQPPAGNQPDEGFAVPADEMDGWQIVTESTLAPERMRALHDAITGGEFPLLDAIAIAHRGELVVDLTRRTATDRFDVDVGNTDPRLHMQFSVSKGMAALMVGVAIENGDIVTVETPYLTLFPYDSAELKNPDPRKTDITLHHVLSMKAGFDWDEFDPPFGSPDNQLFSTHRNSHDWSRALLDLPLAHDPGTEFTYNTIATTSLGQAVENSQPLALVDYAGTYLLAPLQIRDVEVITSPTGLPDLGRGLYLKTRDVAKVGQMLMDGGTWDGQQVVSRSWIDAMMTPTTGFAWTEPGAFSWQISGYGYQWWLGYFEHGGQVYETWSARGFGLQLLMVIPDLELVVAINSHGYDEYDLAAEERHLFSLIADYLVPAAAD